MKYNLWDREWGVFMIKDIFEIKKVKWRPIENYNNWPCPYISTSSNNNWLIWFVKWEKSEISEWNCISVDPIKWISFYHKYDFIWRGFSWASINLLYNKELNQYSYLFLCKAIEITAKYKASYWNLFNSYRLSNAKILLPVDDLWNPDYKFMEDFIKEREKIKREKYRQYVENIIQTLGEDWDFRERVIK